MRFKITGQWKDGYEHDGVLYCAQRIEEMLMGCTSHIYKVPVYNSFLLCREYLRIYDLVQEKVIASSHLSIILDEFLATFNSDIVIREHFADSEIKLFISKIKGNSITEQRKMMYYLFHVMDAYPRWTAAGLKKAVSNPKNKKKIEQALRLYLSMIIGMGYQPDYIYRFCKHVFNNPKIHNGKCVDEFISHFNGVDSEYTVYFAIDRKIEKFKKILESRLGISFKQDKYSSKLRYNSKKYICISKHSTALDSDGAAVNAYKAFSLFMRYYQFLGNRVGEWCLNKSLVIDTAGNEEYLPLKSDVFVFSNNYDDKTLGLNSEFIINELFKNAVGNDFIIIDKIIGVHNNALANHNASNVFLNLWSIAEVVSVYDHTDTKIKQIIKSIVPILKRDYIKTIVEELHSYLKDNISSYKYNKLLDGIKVQGEEEYKIACLLILPENEDGRQKAYKLLKQYPLIRNRICQLYEDVFKTKKKYASELKRYEQKLVWHIQRLYRVRNSIIHSGETDDNIKVLVDHLHSYVDEVILEIMGRLIQENSLCSISNVMMDAQVYLDNMEKIWDKDEPFTPEDVQRMFV